MAVARVKRDEKIEENVKIFKKVCVEMYESSDRVEFTQKGAIVYGKGYDEVVNMVLAVPKYSNLVSGELTLEEVAYIFNITRERVRQTVSLMIGYEKKTGKLGALSQKKGGAIRNLFRELKEFTKNNVKGKSHGKKSR